MWENADPPRLAGEVLRGDLPEAERAEIAPLPAPLRKRASRAQVEGAEAARRSAGRAGLELSREQDDSVSEVHETLAQIDKGEDIAQLDGRLTFAERQIDSLSNRRELAERGIDSELAVMRARLDETLKAFAAATQEHKEIVAVAERRLMALASEAERHSRAMLESLRVELSLKVEEAIRSTAHLEARLRGEKQAFDEEAARRAAVLARSIADAREQLEQRVEAAAEELATQLDAATARIQVSEVRGEMLDRLQAAEDKALAAAEHLEGIITQVRRRLVGDEAEWSAVISEAGEAVAGLRSRVEELMQRVCALEASGATDRGLSTAQLDGVEHRLDLHEKWWQAATNETSSQADRIAGVEAQVSALASLRELAGEQAGAIEYLKARMHEIDNRPEPAPGPAEEAAPAPAEEPVAPVQGPAEPDPALESRLAQLAEGQARLAQRIDELAERLGATGNAQRRRIWG